MKKSISYIVSISCVVFLFACEKEINLNISGEPKLVINALFNPDSLWSVHISRSLSVFSQENPPSVNNATIQLFEDGVLVEELTEGINGHYISAKHTPQLGKIYQIQVTDAVLGKAIANESMDVEKIEITDAHYANVADARHEYPLTIRFTDEPGKKNYYIAKVYAVEENGSVYEATIRSDEITASSDVASADGISFSDALFDGKEYIFKMKLFFPYQKLIVELRNVSEAYYQYHYTHNAQITNPDDPFSTPSELYNNIENGLGIFAAYQSDTMIIVPNQ